MGSNTVISQRTIDWAVASQSLPGQAVCGDLHLVTPIADGVLLAAMDGLGHGGEALAAAKTAVRILEQHAEEPLHGLVRHCHEALANTPRGVVMTVARLSSLEDRLTWLGVGNVEAVLLRAGSQAKNPPEHVLLRNGLVGHQLPQLQPSTLAVAQGDLLVFATDGIAPGFTQSVVRSDSLQQIADSILTRHFKGYDDALVLAVRYIGRGHE